MLDLSTSLRVELTPEKTMFFCLQVVLLALDSIMSETGEAVRYAKSAKDSADRQEIALLETRRDVANLSVSLTNKSTQKEPMTQDYLAALRLGPDAGSAINWPIRR
jgi:Flp pilus assembly protein CpaB